MSSVNASALVNTLGHLAGVLLFGIVLVLLLQDRSARTVTGNKPVLAAALALTWNLASLFVLGTDQPDALATRCMVAFGFSVLSLLPAVLFDLCLSGGPLARAGYLLSATTIIPHIVEVFRPDADMHRAGLAAISIGFGLLTVIAAARAYRQATRLIGTMSLFLLAMSFVHLGTGHAEQIWSQELFFHHAAIPLALLVLLQDYRFVLLDAFLRFVANAALAAVFVTAGVLAWQFGWLPQPASPMRAALLLTGACLALILFAVARTALQGLLTRVVFRRPNQQALLSQLRRSVQDEEEYLLFAADRLGHYVGAEARLSDQPAETSVSLRTSPRHIVFGRRTGGRRYLSEDLDVLRRATTVIDEQISTHRESETRRLVAQAELRALQSQIHPHFLFNALNALYGIIPREAKGARDTVLNLADIFRYFLDTRKTMVPLSEELHIVKAYLEVEHLRLGNKLRTQFHIAPDALDVPIPVLSLEPIVENAVKHGIAPLASGGEVTIAAQIVHGELRVAVRDSGRGFDKSNRSGVGLENVERRLALSYGGAARLEIASSSSGSTVTLQLPAHLTVEAAR
ncbi:MAG: hypothetical protein RL328_2956 [Acidobacteriota bacterium]|jgi:hypothetical protein